MADDERPEHPVLTGVIALVGVALVVGLILGGGALAGARLLGLGDNGSASGGATSSDTLYLPAKLTDPADGNENSTISLPSVPTTSTSVPSVPVPATSTPPPSTLSLSAGQTEVASMQQIDLSGTYPGGEGAILQVQQLSNGQWTDFPVTAQVSNEQFSTFIQTGQVGPNQFRVEDTDTGTTSNVVKVLIN